MTAPDRLTALDTSFLRAETSSRPLHVGAVSVFEGGPLTDEHGRGRLDLVQDAVTSRLGMVPRLCQRVSEVPLWMGRPVWVDDDHFDITHHVKRIHLPAPGTRDQLLALAAELHQEVLDRSRPLWELWLVDGLEGGSVALVEKIHHAMVDGVSGVDVATAILDLDVGGGTVNAPTPLPPVSPPPGWLGLLADAGVDRVRQLARVAASPAAVLDGARRLAGDLARLEEQGIVAPRTSLNRPVGSERRLQSIELDLDDVRGLGRPHGATVNDVVLAAVAGGVRALLRQRGEAPGRPLKVLVPVSLRSAADAMTLGNRVGAFVVPLHVDIDDAEARLVATAAWTQRAKRRGDGEAMADLLGMADALPPIAISAVSRSVVGRQPFVNLVVTNVPGVPVPLYLRGARLLETVPIVPLGGNMPVGVAVLSYAGRLTLGFNADPDAVPDLDVLVGGTADALDATRLSSTGHRKG